MHKLISKIKRSFLKPKLSYEVFEANFNKLPKDIQVKWQRDGRFIIGEISDNSHKFMTQGIGAEDFVEMVNDAIYTAYDVPEDYLDAIKSKKTFCPNSEERKRLENNDINSAIISFKKDEKVLQLA
jgi:hypothetical protein